jgi:D-sedoheptulose 7-phosphate isomerase
MDSLVTLSLNEAAEKLRDFLSDSSNVDDIEKAALKIALALGNGKKVISCGNGGSLCDATHFAEELTGRYRKNRMPLAAIAINDPAYITCTGNDFSFDVVYSRFVEAVGNEGDILLAISTSGNSKNIIKAVEAASNKKMGVIGLTCKSDNMLRKLSDLAICAPYSTYSDRTQEIHIKVIHILVQLIEKHLGY